MLENAKSFNPLFTPVRIGIFVLHQIRNDTLFPKMRKGARAPGSSRGSSRWSDVNGTQGNISHSGQRKVSTLLGSETELEKEAVLVVSGLLTALLGTELWDGVDFVNEVVSVAWEARIGRKKKFPAELTIVTGTSPGCWLRHRDAK